MPYIVHAKRLDMEPSLQELSDYVSKTGDLNYVICRLSIELLRRNGMNYGNFADVVGDIECAKQELYRRLATPYEEEKAKKNGDLDWRVEREQR